MPIGGGIAAFGQGALQGWDKGLSSYAVMEELRLRREAEARARAAQGLQGLIHATDLANRNPEAAQSALDDPTTQGMLPPDATRAGVAEAFAQREAESALGAAHQSGDYSGLPANPRALRLSNRPEHIKLMRDSQDRRQLSEIMNGPGTPQEKLARATSMGLGAMIPAGLISMAHPTLPAGQAGAVADATTTGNLTGEARGGLGAKVAGDRARAVQIGQTDPMLESRLPGRGSRASEVASQTAIGGGLGKDTVDFMPPPSGVSGDTRIQARQIAGETPNENRLTDARIRNLDSDSDRNARWQPGGNPGADKQTELWRKQYDQFQRFGFAQGTDGRMLGPEDAEMVASNLKLEPRLPAAVDIGGRQVPVFRLMPMNRRIMAGGPEAQKKFVIDEGRKWLGKEAIVGVEGDQPIVRKITKEDIYNYYSSRIK